MNRFFIFICLIIFSFQLSAQEEHNTKKAEKMAKKAFKHEDFPKALKLYQEVYQHDSTSVEVNYNLGVCYFNTKKNNSSIPHFEFVKKNRTAGQFTNAEYYLGRAYHSIHDFEKAIKEYNVFNQLSGNANQDLQKEIFKYLKNCEVGAILQKHPVKCLITNCGENVNTKGSETSPVVSPDGKYLYFSTIDASVHHSHHNKDGDPHPGDVHWVKDINGNLSMPYVLSLNSNTVYHDDPVFLSADNNILYFITVNPGRSNDIYYSEQKDHGWTKPVLMPEPFNSTANETGFCLSADGSTAYFSSDRPGGYGGQDLYVVRKNKNGKWGPAVNLGPKINTQYSEEAPFLSMDGKTLYFSSDGLNSIGGYDIFKIGIKDTLPGEPQNLGFPINTAENEKHLRMYAHGFKGYYSSTREGGRGAEDIYFLQIIDTTISKGKYITYYLEEVLFEQGISKPDTGTKLKENIYFDFNASKIADYSVKRLDKVVVLLNNYPDLKLEIQGYTDNKGTEEANHIVSERRAKAVFSYLISKGISPERLKPVGYAAEHPLALGDTELDQARNRRVEFKALSKDLIFKNSEYTGKYYIVKGSFSNKVNAQKAKDKLIASGMSAKILEPNDSNKLYRLVLAESQNYEEAHSLLDELKTKHGDTVWLLSF